MKYSLMSKFRFVLDTNTIVSGVLIPSSIPDLAVQKARKTGRVLFSKTTFDELSQVLFRPKFDKYVSTNVRADFIARLWEESEQVDIVERVTICRDPKDNQFLEVAINGRANYIITGDRDLLILQYFQGLEIITPAQFLETLSKSEY
jgi:putative PIN family toxin of toxin-antitoxin system